ncbi:succinylglutamate desuccinylase/aspartoacylase family protein [Algiphilus sp.]|uniref:succinylglutamate desuccinylase/aspartoacylase family protein n=1 Tax=Algiphilus sp. TaxID=1872431 RepID=UPI0025BE6CFD|nr:succinylglutamate desuccinylase/aspartoacylase family protein [Algiphilus sp.]MCK5771271.1 succinylglutamate desuccinylase/aspartoacylase family protein [Algiphilus sp.]
MSQRRATDFEIDGQRIAPGTRRQVALHLGALYTSAPVTLPVHVVHGRRPGPVLFVSAALHGDEINGIEVIRRVLELPAIKHLAGTLLAVPVVNVLGFLQRSRYLPDRRDLNRSFPGSPSGSLAARIAHRFLTEVVDRADAGIDLHTGALQRPNLPQIRADLGNAATERLARAFGAPLLLDSAPAAGTLREYTTGHGKPVLLYEAGEALRFDEVAIRIGVRGVMNVLREMDMLRSHMRRALPVEPVVAHSSTWVRAPMSGVLRSQVRLGHAVTEGQRVGWVGDPVGGVDTAVYSHTDGIVIGGTGLPLVHEGDALFHIARVEAPRAAARAVTEARRMAQAMPGARARFD